MVPNEELLILTIHFEPPKRGQPLYKGQNAWSQAVLYNILRFHCTAALYVHVVIVNSSIVFTTEWFLVFTRTCTCNHVYVRFYMSIYKQWLLLLHYVVYSEEEATKVLQALPVIPAYIFEQQSIKIWYVIHVMIILYCIVSLCCLVCAFNEKCILNFAIVIINVADCVNTCTCYYMYIIHVLMYMYTDRCECTRGVFVC